MGFIVLLSLYRMLRKEWTLLTKWVILSLTPCTNTGSRIYNEEQNKPPPYFINTIEMGSLWKVMKYPKIQAVKVWGWKKICWSAWFKPALLAPGWSADFFLPPTLTACGSAALWPIETHSTSLKGSKPL